jgi:serine/threonine-protein kinase ULK/ATG1
LEDFESYRKSESFGKFSQAIWEYNEKYKKHYEKMFQCIQKSGVCDKKFEAIFDRDLNEFDSFYLISQSFVKAAQSELFADIPKTGDADAVLPAEVVILVFCSFVKCHLQNQFPVWVIENL